MSSLSQEPGMVEIHSQALRTSWKVPVDLIQMPSSSIVLLVTRAALPVGDRRQLPSLCVLEDNTAAAASISRESSAMAADNPHELIEQDHDIIIRLAVSHSVVKYWLYLRMFWHCRGGEDRLVRSKIAAIEGIADKGPGVLQRWTRVKKGLALIAMLLNARQTLDALLECRTPSLFDKLIYLHVRHHQVPMIAHLVEQVKTTGASNVTTDWMSKVCQSRELEDLPSSSPNEDEDGEDEDSEREAQVESSPPTITARLPSTRSRTAPKVLTFCPTPSPQQKPKRKSVSHARAPAVKRLARARATMSQEDEVEDPAEVEHEAQTRSSASSPSPTSPSSSSPSSASLDPFDITAADGHERRPPSLAEQLHHALVEMHSMPVLEYYYRLLREYPELIHIAAPFSYASHEMYHEAIRHRLEDQCHTRVLLYEREFLLHHSHGLKRMPALMLTGCAEEPALSCSTTSWDSCTSQATKVWLFFPDLEVDDEDERSHNSQKALSVYHRFHPHLAPQEPDTGQDGSAEAAVDDDRPSSRDGHTPTLWDSDGSQLLSLPARLLLQAGVHVLLVIQRAGETVSMPGSSPSRYDSPCAHMVHALPSPTVLSVAGNYCSSQHLLDHIEHQWTRNGGSSLAHEQMERVAIEYPADVFPAGFPTPSPLLKPTTSWLKKRHRALSKDLVQHRQARACELDSPDQMLYLLNRQLDWTISQRSEAPPPGVIHSLGRVLHYAPTPEDRAAALTLLAKAIAMSTSAAQLRPFRTCSLALGCGIGPIPSLPRSSDDDTIQAFRFSAVAHRRPLLFVRATADSDAWARQQAFAQAQLAMWEQGEICRYNVTRTAVCSAPTPAQTVADVIQVWRARSHYQRIQRPQSIAKHHLHPINTIYLQDLCADSEQVRQHAVAELKSCLPAELVDGGVLRWCEVPTDGVHYPSFYLQRCSSDALSNHLASVAITDMHNEPQRLGFWCHILPVEGPITEQRKAVSIHRAVLDDIDLQERVKEMYKLFTEMTKLSSAADVWTKEDVSALSPFVSTSYGELTQASMTKVVECMVTHGLQSDDVFFDVGSCYGRALCHASLVTGIRSIGIEAVPARHNKAMECIAGWDEASVVARIGRHGLATDPLSASVELNHGDIIDHLPLLFTATHVMIFDARFQASTRRILQHVWMSLARTRLRMVLCTTKLRSEPADCHGFELVAELSVTTGQNNFTMYAYRVRPAMSLDATPGDPVVLAVFPGPRIGLRACRDVRVGEPLLPVLGEFLSPGEWEKLRNEASDRRWQSLVRRDAAWMHVLSLARFVSSGCCSEQRDERVNARYVLVGDCDERGALYLESCTVIRSGEEVVACERHAHDNDICPWRCDVQMPRQPHQRRPVDHRSRPAHPHRHRHLRPLCPSH